MSMTNQQLRDYVRSYLDVDEDELPNALVDVWRDEAVARIQNAPWRLRHFQEMWEFTSPANEQQVAYSDLGSDVDEITSVEGENWILQHQPHEAMVRKYAWSDVTGIPIEWSVFSDTIFLWPTPSEAVDIVVRGYRLPSNDTDASAEPDLPSTLHTLVAEWMLARAYEQQDDDIMSANKFARFEQQLDTLTRRARRSPIGGVMVVGGNCFVRPFGRLRFEWE